MAIYHAHIKSFSRGKGESSVAAAAYRAGIDLIDTTKHLDHRYSFRKGVRAYHMLAPEGAPSWCRDPKVFWDANEAWESRANARVARELEVSLPHELTDQQREALALTLGQELVDRYQAVVLVAIHAPSEKGDQRNEHVHLLMSARQVDANGFGARAGAEFDARQGKGAEAVLEVREWVGRIINEHLALAGHDNTVDHRSLRDQMAEAAFKGDMELAKSLDRPPTKHVGKVVTALQRKTAEAGRGISIFGPNDENAFDAAMAKARREGRLVQTTDGHSHAQATQERGSQARTPGPVPAKELTLSQIRRASWPRKSAEASPMAYRLSRIVRLARAQGRDAEVLNAEAEIIEAWLETQLAVARMAIEAVQVIPGIRLESEFKKATEALRERRVHIYGHEPAFYEDTEALSRAIRDYAEAMRKPHDSRNSFNRTRCKVSEAEHMTGRRKVAQLRAARRAHERAKKDVSPAAYETQNKRIIEAMKTMVVATRHLEDTYYITRLDFIPPTAVAATEGNQSGERQSSSSNNRDLRPRTRTRTRFQ